MATWTWTFLPIQQVLNNSGEIKFKDLAETLMTLDPRRFKSEKDLERAIDNYAQCLNYDNVTGRVRFNRKAKKW